MTLPKETLTVLDSVNVRRFLDTLKPAMGIALTKDLYDCTDKDSTLKAANSYLQSPHANKAISDFKIGEPHITTWESIYPLMPLRLYAIEMEERYGYKRDRQPDERAPWPYKETSDTVVYLPEGGVEYWASNTDETDEDILNSLDQDIDKSKIRIERCYSMEMEIPGKLSVDVFIQPVVTQHVIKVVGTISKDGAQFDAS